MVIVTYRFNNCIGLITIVLHEYTHTQTLLLTDGLNFSCHCAAVALDLYFLPIGIPVSKCSLLVSTSTAFSHTQT